MRAILGGVEDPDSARPPTRGTSAPVTVTTAEAAALLVDVSLQRLLEPFITRECTVARAAKELGVTVNSLLYRVKRFQAAGLLEVVREEKRAGRAVKVYRSVADAFYVPFALTRAETVEALLLELDAPLRALLYRNMTKVMTQAETELGLTIWRAEEGDVRTRFAAGPDRLFDPLEPDAPSALPFWSPEVWLEPDDAKALLRDMAELIERYHGRGGRGRYLLHLGLSPLEPGDGPYKPTKKGSEEP